MGNQKDRIEQDRDNKFTQILILIKITLADFSKLGKIPNQFTGIHL